MERRKNVNRAARSRNCQDKRKRMGKNGVKIKKCKGKEEI